MGDAICKEQYGENAEFDGLSNGLVICIETIEEATAPEFFDGLATTLVIDK